MTGRGGQIGHRSIQLLTLIAILCIWQSVAALTLAHGVVPSLIEVWRALWHFTGDPELYRHLGITAYEVVLGFAIATATGVCAGLVLGAQRFAGDVMEPLLAALAATPKIIFYPMLMMLLGIGIESKVALGALSGFFPIAITTFSGVRHLRLIWLKVGRSFNLGVWQMGTWVYLPALLRPILGALRIGLGVAVVGVLVAEMKLAEGGLGFLAMNYYGSFEIAKLYGLLLLIFVLAVALNAGLARLEEAVRS